MQLITLEIGFKDREKPAPPVEARGCVYGSVLEVAVEVQKLSCITFFNVGTSDRLGCLLFCQVAKTVVKALGICDEEVSLLQSQATYKINKVF